MKRVLLINRCAIRLDPDSGFDLREFPVRPDLGPMPWPAESECKPLMVSVGRTLEFSEGVSNPESVGAPDQTGVRECRFC